MSKLLEGKTALVLGVWNKWSIAYAIAQAFAREGATLLLTYQNERAKPVVEELGQELGAAAFFPCDVQNQPETGNAELRALSAFLLGSNIRAGNLRETFEVGGFGFGKARVHRIDP